MERTELTLTLEDHEKAFTEASFLLEMLVRTIGEVVGRSSASLGTNAGRHMARKLPVRLENPTPEMALDVVTRRLSDGFEVVYACDDTGADMTVRRCALRDVCGRRDLELGGELCRMFHAYLGGMTAELLGGRPVRAGEPAAGDTCTFRLDIK